jgi:predicted TIM-barrel fold metal-dependent hydrolase
MKGKPMIIEWNAHMFSRDLVRYPWHPRAVYTPSVDQLGQDPLADYMLRMEREGIDKAVLVHPEPYGDDHRLILDCLAREPGRFKGTCLFYSDDDGAPERLRALVRREPRIVALRFHAHRGKEHYLRSFADAGVRALWRQAAELGLLVELHIGPNYAAEAGEAIRAFPGTRVLIDHLAEPHMGNAVEYAEVLALARLPNVIMKLSGLNHFAHDAPLYESARHFTRLVADAFGPQRLVWGAGTPGIVDAHLGHWGEAERALVKGGNLEALVFSE